MQQFVFTNVQVFIYNYTIFIAFNKGYYPLPLMPHLDLSLTLLPIQECQPTQAKIVQTEGPITQEPLGLWPLSC